jgi:arsenate reductase (thioredoxin)
MPAVSNSPPPRHALVLCTGNSARSILGEALIAHLGAGRWHAHSAGSTPTGRINPYALATLARHEVPAPTNARSKSWSEFAIASAPKMDLIVTVCDSAANEVCPVWPGAPFTAHWGLPDPAAALGEAALTAAFESAYETISARVRAMMLLDFDVLEAATLRLQLRAIAQVHA